MKKTDVFTSNHEIWTIPNIYIVIFVGLLTIWLTFVTTNGELTIAGHKRWYKRLTNNGMKAIIIGFLITVALAFQEINNGNISENKDNVLKVEQLSRNNQITEAVRVNRKQLFDDLSLALNKQGIQFDTIKNQIGTLKNLNKKTNILHPLLRITNLKIVDSSSYLPKRYKFSYELTSDDSPSYNTHVLFDVFGFTPEGKIVELDRNRDLLYKGQTIPKEIGFTSYIGVIVNYHISLYAFRLKGFYFSSDKTKIPVDDIYLLQLQNKKMSFVFPGQFHDNVVRKFIKENNIK